MSVRLAPHYALKGDLSRLGEVDGIHGDWEAAGWWCPHCGALNISADSYIAAAEVTNDAPYHICRLCYGNVSQAPNISGDEEGVGEGRMMTADQIRRREATYSRQAAEMRVRHIRERAEMSGYTLEGRSPTLRRAPKEGQ